MRTSAVLEGEYIVAGVIVGAVELALAVLQQRRDCRLIIRLTAASLTVLLPTSFMRRVASSGRARIHGY